MNTLVLDKPRSRRENPSLKAAMDRVQTAACGELQSVVLRRSMDAISRCVERANHSDLEDMASAPTNYDVLLKQLNEFVDVLVENDPLASARLRGLKMKEELLEAAGGALTAEETGKILHLTRQAVDKRRKTGRLIALDVGRRGYIYPLFQFDEKIWPFLDKVLAEISPRIQGWGLLAFFLNENDYLDGDSPLDKLQQGKFDEVLRAAKSYGMHGAP